jgi:arylsulfatase A-like enzyme/Flp pilus assembly protein TadD
MKIKNIHILLLVLLLGMAAFFFLTLSRSATRLEPTNLLLITLDTVRADRLGCYGDRFARTPAMDDLARKGVFFKNCYSPAPLTLPAHCSLFTGRWPIAHGVRNNGSYKLDATELTLAEKLKTAGYDTGALIAAYVLKNKFGLAQGFDLYDDRLDFEEKTGNIDAQITADRVYAKFSNWLEHKGDKPFFLWAHFYDPHKPYAPPPAFLQASAGDAYRGEVAYVDHYIGRMVADLKERKLLEHTLIVIVGDHGEGFGEHGEKGHGIFAYDESLKVPLIFFNAALLNRPARIGQPVSLVDIMPTVLEILGVTAAENSQGKSLANVMAGAVDNAIRPLYLETMYGMEMNNWAPLTGLLKGNFKYISLPQSELYDLETDAPEKDNLFFKNNPLARQMDRELGQFIVANSGKQKRDVRISIQGDDKKKLAALGYISSFSATGQAKMDPKTGFGYQLIYEKLVAALNRGEIASVEAEALRLRDETAALKLPYTYLMLHYVYEKKEQWDKVEDNLRHACDFFKDSPTQALPFRGNLLEFYFANNNLDAAEQLAMEMLRLYPDKTRVLEVLGEIYEKRQDWSAALNWYMQAKKIETSNDALAKKTIKMLIKTGNNQTALAESEALLKTVTGTNDLDLLFSAAMLAIETGNTTRSEEYLLRLTAIQPTAQRWFDYALVLGRNGKLSQAITTMEKALALMPNDLDSEKRQAAAKALQVWKTRRR